jgi:hypothetical protein
MQLQDSLTGAQLKLTDAQVNWLDLRD